MTRKDVGFLGLIALIGVVLTVLGTANWRMGQRVETLELIVAQGLSVNAARTDAGTDAEVTQRALKMWREEQAASDTPNPMTEERAAELIEAALDDAVERKAAETKEAEVARYMEVAEESIRMEVEDLQKAFSLTDAQRDGAIELTVQGMVDGHHLRKDLENGDITVRQAKEEGEVIKQDYYDELEALLGTDAFEALGEQFYPGKGWE